MVAIDGTGPADAALVVDVDAPGGGASCTSPVGGGRSVSRVEPPLVPGEPQAAAVAVTMSATSTFHLRIVALSPLDETPGPRRKCP